MTSAFLDTNVLFSTASTDPSTLLCLWKHGEQAKR